MDHFVSGALIAGMGASVFNLSSLKSGEISTKTYAKKVAKLSIDGGVAAFCAINASNQISQKNYLNAAIFAVSGVVMLTLNDRLLKE